MQNLTFVKASCHPVYWAANEAFGYGSTLGKTKPKVKRACRAYPELLLAASSQRQLTASNAVTSNTSDFEAYLEQQGTMNFVNLASRIA